MKSTRFSNLDQAGRELAGRLASMSLRSPLVLAIPRGGLPVARRIAEELRGDLDIAPGPESLSPESMEFAPVTADKVLEQLGFDPRGRDVIIVEDRVTNGANALAAARYAFQMGASRVIIAAPVVYGTEVQERLRDAGFETVSLHISEVSESLDAIFENLESVRDIEVHEVRERARQVGASMAIGKGTYREMAVDTGERVLTVKLIIPPNPRAVVLVIGDANSQAWLRRLQDRWVEGGFAIVSPQLGDNAGSASAIRHMVEWLAKEKSLAGLAVGCVAGGDRVEKVIEVAASVPELVRCIVAVSGRPDRAEDFLARLLASTLLIVGENDPSLIPLNRRAFHEILCEKALVLIPSAGRGFDGSSEFNELLQTSTAWLNRFLNPSASASLPTEIVQ